MNVRSNWLASKRSNQHRIETKPFAKVKQKTDHDQIDRTQSGLCAFFFSISRSLSHRSVRNNSACIASIALCNILTWHFFRCFPTGAFGGVVVVVRPRPTFNAEVWVLNTVWAYTRINWKIKPLHGSFVRDARGLKMFVWLAFWWCARPDRIGGCLLITSWKPPSNVISLLCPINGIQYSNAPANTKHTHQLTCRCH